MTDDPGRVLLVSRPFSESMRLRSFVFIASLVTTSLSLWFFTAGSIRISQPLPDAFFFATSLPVVYWLGLATTLALFGVRRFVSERARTLFDLMALTLFSLYLFGLPSMVYQDPRILDSYQHEGNALALLGAGGWFNGPIWYVFQFPGAYTFFAQLSAVPGVDPFQLMKFYPMGAGIILILMLYALAKSYSPNYAGISAAFIMSGLWFQLHLSPQSLELILYLGVLYLLRKIVEDAPRRELWETISLLVIPILVLSHPETPLVLLLGVFAFLVLKPLVNFSGWTTIRSSLLLTGPFFAMLALVTLAWWSGIASQALAQVQSIINGALTAGVPGLSHGAPNIPPTPAPSYQLATLFQEGISASVWLLGLAVMLFIRRFNNWEYLLSGLFLAAVSTIPIALFANADVLQRSYLFALIPAGLLFAALLERRDVMRIRTVSFTRPFALAVVLLMIVFAFSLPLARYAGDSFDYLPQSSLSVSSVAASLTSENSILFPHPGWYGWRIYTPYYGYYGGLLLEQSNMSSRTGGFVKVNTYSQFNLTFTAADGTAHYLLVSDYFNNLYTMRFGSNSTFFIDSRAHFEADAATRFNLIFSSGTDRLYENRVLG